MLPMLHTNPRSRTDTTPNMKETQHGVLSSCRNLPHIKWIPDWRSGGAGPAGCNRTTGSQAVRGAIHDDTAAASASFVETGLSIGTTER
ncbi:hypothetical protein C2L66_34050 [Paraburkholderia caribensis]|nr:hypothetical protein C2L66_34050 [Paraburkholderia caribensis]